MFARVLRVNDERVYLEIDRQLRFSSRYILGSAQPRITESCSVDFDFTVRGGAPWIVIRKIDLSPADASGR